MAEQREAELHETHQPLFSRLRRAHSQIVSPGVEGVDLDAPVGLRLPQPHGHDLLHVYALPGADPGVHVDLQGADPYLPPPLRGRHQPGDLQENGGRFARGAHVNPQLRTDDPAGLKLMAEGEEAARWFPARLNDRVGCRNTESGGWGGLRTDGKREQPAQHLQIQT